MAEARNAIGMFDEHKRGVKLFMSDDGIEISFTIPHPREIRQSILRQVFQFKRTCLRAMYPASPAIVVVVVGVVVACVLSASPHSWLRNGAIAWTTWSIGNFLIPFANHIPTTLYVAYLAAWCALGGLLLFVFVQRLVIRGLLSYRGWLYQQLRQQSRVVLLWGGLLKLLTGKNPLTFSFQNALPRLPVPTLQHTIERYLKSVHPLLNNEEFQSTKKKAHEFLATVGPKFQRYLQLKSWCSSNYVSDWWEQFVYLRGRNSLMINSNYYCLDSNNHRPSNDQIARAAGITYQMMKFKRALDREQLPPQLIRDVVPLCMSQYKRIFSTNRIPKREEDELKHYPVGISKHIAVLIKGQIFKLPLFKKGRVGALLSPFEIQFQLQRIVEEAKNNLSLSNGEKFLAALTSESRIVWAEARERYFSEGINKISLEVVESAVFCLVLDDDEPTDWTSRGHALMHGNGCNRWFDKSFNFIVFANGVCGLNTEHSWADAPVIAHVYEHCLTLEFSEEMYNTHGQIASPPTPMDASSIAPPTRLKWNIGEQLETIILSAKTNAEKSINDLQLNVVCHDAFGKGFMKQCKLSPDAFIQMGLQLAYFKDSGGFTQTYEASMTRLYLNGRTETVRSASDDSVAFVLGMQDENVSNKEKIKLLRSACDTHQMAYRDAMSGKGIDRHLFTLYCVSVGMGIESEFLKDALGRPWRLSTSQQPQEQTTHWKDVAKIAAKLNVVVENIYSPGGGFGPVVDDGYGVSYMITGENKVFFHISSKKSAENTDSIKFGKCIFEAFSDIRRLFED